MRRYLRDPTFSRSDTILECDRHTDTQTDRHTTTAYTALSIASSGKNDTDVAHYNFNAHKPISLIFGTDITEWVRYRTVICYPTLLTNVLSTTWGNMNPRNWVFSVMLSTVSALAWYIFDTYQPILIIFFVDSKTVVLSTVYKYYFSLGHFCVTPVRQQDQCYQLCGYCVICCYQNNGWPTQ